MSIALVANTKVYLALEPVDMRKGFDGLSAQVQQSSTSTPSPATCSCSAASAATA